MSEINPLLRWTLSRECPLRAASDWETEATRKARQLGRYSDDPASAYGEHRGTCITSAEAPPLNAGFLTGTIQPRFLIADGGFSIAEQFGALGGTTGLRALCGNCPAHAYGALVGCSGHLAPFRYVRDGEQWDDNLRRLAEELDLLAVIADEFPPTRQLWYGFWIDSPLSRRALQILKTLLGAVLEQRVECRSPESLADFLVAIERALAHDLPLRAEMHPAGICTLGVVVIGDHCPRCKASAWPHNAPPLGQHTCEMCGAQYLLPPDDDTPSFIESPAKLRSQMPLEAYREFAISHLQKQGATLDEAMEIMDAHDVFIEKRRRLGYES